MTGPVTRPVTRGGSIRGVGIDTSDVTRFERLYARYGQRFVARWFTAAEIAQCSATEAMAAEYAARFAAKEAIWKALRLGGWPGTVPWPMISVVRLSDPGSAPRVTLTGAVERAARAAGVTRMHVEFGTVGSVSVATAVTECG